MYIGDHVFFYEYKGNKAVIGQPPRPIGREGIVRIATVSGPLYYREDVLRYTEGDIKDWSWKIPCDENVNTEGFVPRIKVLEVLKYKLGGRLRSFNGGKGIMKLNEEQAQTLLELFKSATRRKYPTR